MDDMHRGLYRKYKVRRTDGGSEPGGRHEDCHYFVLDLDHDPYALPALEAYYEACRLTHLRLAEDLRHILVGLRIERDKLAGKAQADGSCQHPTDKGG
jgi:hypothetical protein